MSVERLELPPLAFVVRCSKFQLSYTDKIRMAGFEPASACSQDKWATAAPHPETMEPAGLEPAISGLQDRRLPHSATIPELLIGAVGIEPTTSGL
jgi:hypothetical protein